MITRFVCHGWRYGAAFVLLLLWTPPQVCAGEIPIMRVTHVEETGEPLAMQTPVLTLQTENGDDGVTATIYGAVHIGEASYYNKLNELFANHEVLLYELVAPEGVKPQRGQNSFNPLALFQQALGDALGLVHQLERIDYHKPNFVHADMSPQQMQQSMAEGGDNMLTLALSTFLDAQRAENRRAYLVETGQAEPNPLETIDLSVVLKPGGSRDLKLILAQSLMMNEELTSSESTMGRYVIVNRNDACCDVFAQQIASGKKDIAIFYGAAHLPDLVTSLEERFGFHVVQTSWLNAIDLTTAPELAPHHLVIQNMGSRFLGQAIKGAFTKEERQELSDTLRELSDLIDSVE